MSLTLDNVLHNSSDYNLDNFEHYHIIIYYNKKFRNKIHCNEIFRKINKNTIIEYLKTGLYINPKIDICCICLDNFKTEKNAFITECGHKYHKTCIFKYLWINNKSDCCYCRNIHGCGTSISFHTEMISNNITIAKEFNKNNGYYNEEDNLQDKNFSKNMWKNMNILCEINEYDSLLNYIVFNYYCTDCDSSNYIKNRHKCKKCYNYVYNY